MAAVVCAVGVGFGAAHASADVHIYLSHPNQPDDAKLLGKVEKAKCRVKGSGANKRFVAVGHSTNKNVDLHVKIDPSAWDGFGPTYQLYAGDEEVDFLAVVDSAGNAPSDGFYTNAYAVPGTAGLNVGEIRFSEGGKKLHIGSWYGPNRANPEYGAIPAGELRCRYP